MADGRLVITSHNLDIFVNGAGSSVVTISGIDGCVLHRAEGDTRYQVPAPGIYIVAAGGNAVKIAVR